MYKGLKMVKSVLIFVILVISSTTFSKDNKERSPSSSLTGRSQTEISLTLHDGVLYRKYRIYDQAGRTDSFVEQILDSKRGITCYSIDSKDLTCIQSPPL